jgi:two-component system, LytTR family, sensor kinase
MNVEPQVPAPGAEIVVDASGVNDYGGELHGGRSLRLFWALTVGLILLFWVSQWGAITLLRMARMPNEGTSYFLPRAGACTFAFFQSIGILAIQWRLRRRSFGVRAFAALGLAFVGASLHSIVNQFMFDLIMDDFWATFAISDPLLGILDFLWSYLALSAMLLALAYAVDVRDREDRINALQALAHSAQLRALRNQLNPHFLFNTLNSITSLISRGRDHEAERMTESLADFLRQMLALDPQKQITLSEEIQLQELYLAIEKARFPDRLRVRLAIPDALKGALVPSLITQPLVENSIKYAVARSSDPVQLEIAASEEEGMLALVVQDNGGNADAPPPRGARVGLANVTERLRVHYGDSGRLDAHARAEGGFCNRITLPLQLET